MPARRGFSSMYRWQLRAYAWESTSEDLKGVSQNGPVRRQRLLQRWAYRCATAFTNRAAESSSSGVISR